MKEPETLWEQEQQEAQIKARKQRIDEYRKLSGNKFLYNVIDGMMIEIPRGDPTETLKRAGYVRKLNNSWVRQFSNSRKHRFHAYILSNNRIEIHTDETRMAKNGRSYHMASLHGTKGERKRLKKWVPPDPNLPPPPPKPISQKKKYKSEVLPIHKLRQALAQIKIDREQAELKRKKSIRGFIAGLFHRLLACYRRG